MRKTPIYFIIYITPNYKWPCTLFTPIFVVHATGFIVYTPLYNYIK